MPELQFAIPMLAVTDVARSVAFYESIGFVTQHQDEDYAIFTQDAIEIHIWRWENMPFPFDPHVNANGCFIRVRGIDELHTRLNPLGIVPENGQLRDRPWGRDFTALDPDNNALHFTEPK